MTTVQRPPVNQEDCCIVNQEDCCTVNQEDQGSKPSASKLGHYSPTTLPVSLGRDRKSHWSLLPDVYARGSKKSHTRGKCVICRGNHRSIGLYVNSLKKNTKCFRPGKGLPGVTQNCLISFQQSEILK